MNNKEIERWYRLKSLKKTAQVLVAVFVVALAAGYAATRVLGPKTEQFKTSKIVDPGIRVERFSYSSPPPHPWELEAASGTVAESLDKATLKAPRVVYHGGQGNAILVSAETGLLDKKTRNVSASGDVTIKFEEFVFTTPQLEYSDEKQLARTEAPIRLEGKDLSLSGVGLSLSIEKEEIVIEQDVKARLFNVKWVGPDSKLPM